MVNWWFGLLVWISGIPENERDSYLGLPLESQTTHTTNLPLGDTWGNGIQFDVCIFFRGVGEKPPTSVTSWRFFFQISTLNLAFLTTVVPTPQFLDISGRQVHPLPSFQKHVDCEICLWLKMIHFNNLWKKHVFSYIFIMQPEWFQRFVKKNANFKTFKAYTP